jgi:acyl-coenzyme A synthetase/AMP-(fatty) acid ligase
VRDYCKGRIAHFKIPRHIWFVTEFPMTVTGKLQKFRMREIATEKMGLTEKAAEPGKPGKPENTAKQGKAEAGAG